MILEGVTASTGMCEGSAYCYLKPELSFEAGKTENTQAEVIRVQKAFASAVEELSELKTLMKERLSDEFAHIFRSQQTVAEDQSIQEEVLEKIRNDKDTAETAVSGVFTGYIDLFNQLDDSDYNKARGADIQDVYQRILRILLGVKDVSLANLPAGTVVAARELFPSDTALMDAECVAGLLTELGGATSHVAILANNLGIPAAAGVKNLMQGIHNNDHVCLDSSDSDLSRVIINPDEKQKEEFNCRKKAFENRLARISGSFGKCVSMSDGKSVTLSANVGSDSELAPAFDHGARSVGLYRSEFLFMNSPSIPAEEQQYQAYMKAAEIFKDGFVIIRTLDIGGDKQLPALPLPHENNPFLGNRALRLCLDRPELFIMQLRSILRAGALHGNIKMMFPMVSGLPELEQAFELLEKARQSLEEDGLDFDRDMETGIMIEVPSAVFVAESLARRVSFFSIGTNDLTQYLLAADRENSLVNSYYRRFDPSVFQSVHKVVQAADKHNKWVGVCGELGGHPLAVPLLLGLGVSELSMSPRALPEAAWIIRNSSQCELESLASRALAMDSEKDIIALLREYYESKEK